MLCLLVRRPSIFDLSRLMISYCDIFLVEFVITHGKHCELQTNDQNHRHKCRSFCLFLFSFHVKMHVHYTVFADIAP